MKIRTRYFEMSFTFLTRSERVRRDIAEVGKLPAIKLYRERYGVGLKEAYDFIQSVEKKAE